MYVFVEMDGVLSCHYIRERTPLGGLSEDHS